MELRSDANNLAALYEQAFRALLCRTRGPRLQPAIDRALRCARRIAEQDGQTSQSALAAVYAATRKRIVRRLLRLRSPRSAINRHHWKMLFETTVASSAEIAAPYFHCDAALGGVARWLRAAGYDAAFWPGIDDDLLLEKTCGQPSILLTTDTLLFQRGMIHWGAIAARLVSIRLNGIEQFLDVMKQLSLPVLAPRCMACGGYLKQVPKASVRLQIPPRTYPWLDDYFHCNRCGKLFWKGTHWQRIGSVLDSIRNAQRVS